MKSSRSILQRIAISQDDNPRKFNRPMLRSLFVGALGLMTGLAGSASAANIAPLGQAVLGVNNAVDNDAGTTRANGGVPGNLNDNDLNTRIDTWFGTGGGDGGQAFSYAGIVWPVKRYEQVQSLNATFATFFDGGWFGSRGTSPGAGGLLTPAHLIEPTIQISTNAGISWITVPHTSNYLTALNGHGIGGGENPNPSTVSALFTLQTPITEIDGIRIIGENGGQADGNGFIGLFELEVNAEPSADSDGDGLPDSWERANGLNVGANDAATDDDADGLTNLEEYNASTNPKQTDTDNDGLNDAAEIRTSLTKPLIADTDGDGLTDGREVNETKTDPNTTDSDQDGLTDGAEVNTLRTNPLAVDTDNDSFPDAVEVAQGSDPTNPSSGPTNVALFGRGIMGTKDSLESGPETEVELFHVGTAENINDGLLTTRVDTYNADQPGTVSFVGIVWDQPVTNAISRLELTLATFFDGGWFGVNNVGPGDGGKLTAAHLKEPQVEVSRDGGASWSVVPHTSDYQTALLGHGIGGGLNPNPTSVKTVFNLTQPETGITGIRIIGNDGGTASGGFIGVFELGAHFNLSNSATDTDNDGIEDAWERQNGLVVGTNDATGDPDNDGLQNRQEFTAKTNPQAADTDSDTLNDGAELNQHNSDPLRADTDGDGLSDGQEVNLHKTNPTLVDSDIDGFSDSAEINNGSNPNLATSTPTNLALLGTGILGTKEAVDSGAETAFFNAGSAASINDGNLTTRVDTFNGGGTDTASFVGVVWERPITNPIVRLELTHAIFYDGGWFGVGGVGPGTGGNLSAAEHLADPIVQVTTDRGTNWTTIAHTSDYTQALNGHPLPAVDGGEPTSVKATFQLTQPQSNINGIRLLGTEGGTASGGFLGVFEFAAHSGTNSIPQGFTLGNASVANNQIRFDFESKAGVTHTVQYKTALGDAAWQTLTTVTGDGTRKQVTDNLTGTQRFYRVTTQ